MEISLFEYYRDTLIEKTYIFYINEYNDKIYKFSLKKSMINLKTINFKIIISDIIEFNKFIFNFKLSKFMNTLNANFMVFFVFKNSDKYKRGFPYINSLYKLNTFIDKFNIYENNSVDRHFTNHCDRQKYYSISNKVACKIKFLSNYIIFKKSFNSSSIFYFGYKIILFIII